MTWLRELWRKWTTSSELALLKAENRRLKEANFALEEELGDTKKELRAAVNNLLSHAGVAPLPPHEETPPPRNRMRNLTLQQRQRLYAVATAAKPPQKEGTNG